MGPTDQRAGEEGPGIGPAEFLQDVAGTVIAMARNEGARVRLEASRKVGGLAAATVMVLVVLFVGMGTVTFLCLAWGLWLGRMLNSMAMGMLLAAASLLLVFLLFHLLWRWRLRDRIILAVVNELSGHE